MPEGLFFIHHTGAEVAAKHAVFHHIAGDVEPRTRHVIIAAALPEIDLKHAVAAVPAVVFNVKIGKTRVTDVLQERFQFCHQRLIVFGDDGRVIAQRLGRVLLQAHMAQAHHLHAVVFIAVGCQHMHEAVVAGNSVLQNDNVRVARAVDLRENGRGLLRRGGGIHFLHAVEGVLPVQNAAGGLYDYRVREAQRFGRQGGGVHGAFGAEGFGVGDAVLVAQSVKIRLGNQLVPQLRRDVRRDAVRGQLVPDVHEQAGVIVGTTHDDERFVRVCGGEIRYRAQQCVRAVDVRHGGEADQAGIHGIAHGPAAKGVRTHAVGLVEGARQRVAVHVRADEHGQDGFGNRHQKAPLDPVTRADIYYFIICTNGGLSRRRSGARAPVASVPAGVYKAVSPVCAASFAFSAEMR